MSCKSESSSKYSGSSNNHRAEAIPAKGFPQKCECGSRIVRFTSKIDNNPGRVFFRCANQEGSKKHVFKWFDEATMEEIEKLKDGFESVQRVMEKLVCNGEEEKIEALTHELEIYKAKVEKIEVLAKELEFYKAKVAQIEADKYKFVFVLVGIVMFLYYYGLPRL
ncbi:PREDICTED: uncharacterized protein At4g04775-like [Tarenaya hassleriana]|uniref:uncharacterized protein At4g04775-like n=1 Tax=Tarenaya hassleriana TaxID=28532 RepID=UPI00053C8986|nr:PREDICTED: uncharacterized protein At4g04775-like [Tarenaya hassleriana]